MRGSPPLQLALLLLSFIALAIPLVQLTSARAARSADHSALAVITKAVPVTVRLRYAHQPLTLSLTLDGKPLLPDASLKSSPIDATTEVEIPKDGVDLQVKATWPTGTPDTALTLEVEPDGLDAQTQTRWSVGSTLDEIIPFIWKL